jgi:hypothetical protein
MSVVPWTMARPSAKRVRVWGPRRKRRRRSLERRVFECRRVSAEAGAEGGEIDGAMVLVDLDGIAAAESDVGAVLAGEVGEGLPAAYLAAGTRRGGGDLGAVQVFAALRRQEGRTPEVEGEQGAAHEMRLAGEELERLGDLDGGGQVDGGGKDAGGVAGFQVAGGRLGKDAGETGGWERREQGTGNREADAGRMFMVAA